MVDPGDYCGRELDDGTHCGGRLARAIRGRRTGRWFRTCTRCFTTITLDGPPPEISDAPINWRPRVEGLAMTWQAKHETRDEETE